MTLAKLSPEQGLALRGCPKLDKDDVFLVASSPAQPLNVTEEYLSFKPSKTRQPVTFKYTNHRLLKSYYDLGVKPGESTKYEYSRSQFKKQTIILNNRKSNASSPSRSPIRSTSTESDQTNLTDSTNTPNQKASREPSSKYELLHDS